MKKLFCSLYPEKHGGFVSLNGRDTCPDCGSAALTRDKIERINNE